MIGHIALREFGEHLRGARFLSLCVLAAVLLPLTAHVNAARYRTWQELADALRREARVHATAPIMSSDQYQSRFGWRAGDPIDDPALRIVRDPVPLAALSVRGESHMPAYWRTGTEGLEEGPSFPALASADDPAALDAVHVVEMILGLLAILLVFDTISGDRETGVLRAMLAHPVARVDILVGKYVGAVLALFVPLVVGLLAAVLVLRGGGVPVGSSADWTRLGLFLGVSALYLCTMLAIGLAVSAGTRSARTSLVVLLVGWVASVIVAPRAAEQGASMIVPVVSAQRAADARRAAVLLVERDRARALAEVWRRTFGTDERPDDLTPELRRRYNESRQPVEAQLVERKRAQIRALDDERRALRRRQRTLATRLARLSPAGAFEVGAAAALGTGAVEAERLELDAWRQQRRLEALTFDRVFGVELYPPDLGYLRLVWWPDPRDATDLPPPYEALPRLEVVPSPVSRDLPRVLPDVGVFLIVTVAALAIATMLMNRAEIA